MTERIGYKLNPNKLKKAPQGILPYVCGAFYYTEDYEYFDVIKPYLDIPEKHKTLEEIEQELNEKFDELLVKTKRKFDVSKRSAEYHFDKKFDRINKDFEYIKEWGRLPYITLDPTVTPQMYDAYLVSTGSAPQWKTEFRFGKDNVGYYFVEPGVKFHMSKKPNFIVRHFLKLLLNLEWKSTK